LSDLTTSIRIAVQDAFTPNLRKLGSELRGVAGDARKLKDNFQLSANLNQAAEGMGRFSTALSVPLKQTISDFGDLDEALAKVSAKTGEARGSSAFEALKDQAVDLGAATKYAAAEVASAQAEFAASGRNAQEILGSIPSTLSLATAGTINLARATEITNEVLNQFNLTADKTAHAQDVLARADEVSAASVDGLGEALSYVGTTAARMNISLEETSALLAVLANSGQKSSTGGTNLTAFLSSIVAPSKMAKDSLRDLGLSMKEIQQLQTDVATGNIDVAIKKMAALNAQLDPRKSAEVLDKVFGERGGRAASVLFRASFDTGDKGLDALIAKFGEADGAVMRTAKIMESHLNGELEKASGAITGLSTQLGEALAPTVVHLARDVGEWADGATKLAQAYPEATANGLELVGTLALTAAGIKGLLLAASAYTGAVGLMTSATATAAVTMGTLSASTLGFAAAAGVAGYALGTFISDALDLKFKLDPELKRNNKLSQGQAYRGDEARGLSGTELDANGNVVKIDEKYFSHRKFANYKDTVGTEVPGMAAGDEVPAIVREAISNGANSREEINEYIKQKRHQEREDAKANATPWSNEAPKPAPLVEVDPEVTKLQRQIEKLERKVSEGTAVERDMKALLKLQAESVEELKRINRRRAGGGGGGGGYTDPGGYTGGT
jgi:TP901 family phage tail tape measure protein